MTNSAPIHRHLRRQRGVVLIFAMIALVIMLIGAVAISRSISSSQFNISNLGFKRDLANQSERVVRDVLNSVRATGLLGNPTTRFNNYPAANYSAVKLPDNPQGIPNILLQSNAAFGAFGTAADIRVIDQQVEARYVVERLALTTGDCTNETCVLAVPPPSGGSVDQLLKGPPPPQPMYRLTVRVTGPRNTMSFFQSTFTAD